MYLHAYTYVYVCMYMLWQIWKFLKYPHDVGTNTPCYQVTRVKVREATNGSIQTSETVGKCSGERNE